jgi:hypothetical protein
MARGPGVALRAKLAAQEAKHAKGSGCPCCTMKPLIARLVPLVGLDDDGT